MPLRSPELQYQLVVLSFNAQAIVSSSCDSQECLALRIHTGYYTIFQVFHNLTD